MLPKAVLFDVDDTLAESFRPPTNSMLARLRELLDRTAVGIISAAGFPRIERDFVATLTDSPNAKRLYVLPNSSAQAYTWADGWNEEYSLALSDEERAYIEECIRRADPSPDPRARIIDRGVQVAYAAIGLDASFEDKKTWDPDQSKRTAMKTVLDAMLPEYEVLIGGMTTIDITKKGINKAYGVRWMAERLRSEPHEMLYIGDALYPGGNDYVVIETGVQVHQVKNPSETEEVVESLLTR
ncbi:MAG TPA: HAD hydrolase family protein [Candidatus Paceibacterota bacterium]|nr:HAD hydrolase family protein [Candidatus Paceibacterota bacterium]